MEIIVKVRATALNSKMIATGTPKTSRSAFTLEIQQKYSPSKERENRIPFSETLINLFQTLD